MSLTRKLKERKTGETIEPTKKGSKIAKSPPKPTPQETAEERKIREEAEKKVRKRKEEDRKRKKEAKEKETQKVKELEDKILSLEQSLGKISLLEGKFQKFENLEERVKEILQQTSSKAPPDQILKSLMSIRPEDLRETMKALKFTEKQINRACVRHAEKGTSQGKAYRDTEDMIRILNEYLKTKVSVQG